MPSGPQRTHLMTGVVSGMIRLAPLLTNYEMQGELKQKDGGLRLAAYAYLYTRPDRKLLAGLVNSLVDIEK